MSEAEASAARDKGHQATPEKNDPVEDVPAAAASTRSVVSGVATSIAGAAAPVISAARRVIEERGGARVRKARRQGRQPLANLWEVHPEAHRAAMRELGLRTVPIDQIAGTAVEGPTQRGGDFLPLRQLRGRDWRSRWQRILNGIDQLVTLPPVDLVKFGDRYWVLDGHNRVAAALYTGQIAIDANVVEMRLPGMPSEPATGNLASYLEATQDVRAAGHGRYTRTNVPRTTVPAHPLDEHGDEHGDEPGRDPAEHHHERSPDE